MISGCRLNNKIGLEYKTNNTDKNLRMIYITGQIYSDIGLIGKHFMDRMRVYFIVYQLAYYRFYPKFC